MEPSANVSSRTPGAISLPGMGSAFVPRAGGSDTAIGTCAPWGVDGADAGAGESVFAGSDATGADSGGLLGVGTVVIAAATFCGGFSSTVAAGDGTGGAGSSVFETAVGSAAATFTGFTSE